jgi:hypothetical protein
MIHLDFKKWKNRFRKRFAYLYWFLEILRKYWLIGQKFTRMSWVYLKSTFGINNVLIEGMFLFLIFWNSKSPILMTAFCLSCIRFPLWCFSIFFEILSIFQRIDLPIYLIAELLKPYFLSFIFYFLLLGEKLISSRDMLPAILTQMLLFVFNCFKLIKFRTAASDTSGMGLEINIKSILSTSGLIYTYQQSFEICNGSLIRTDFIVSAGWSRIILDAKNVWSSFNKDTMESALKDMLFRNYPSWIPLSNHTVIIILPWGKKSFLLSDYFVLLRGSAHRFLLINQYNIWTLFWITVFKSAFVYLSLILIYFQHA